MNTLNPRDNSIIESFYELIERLQEHLACAGIHRQALSRIPRFSILDSSTQKYIVTCLDEYVQIIETAKCHSSDANFDKQFIWNSFRKLDLQANDEIFKYYEDDMVVEFYTMEGIQIFRNFNFFKVCSYTLEDIFTRKWFELFDRDECDTEALKTSLTKIKSGTCVKAFKPEVAPHRLTERDSIERNVIEFEMAYLVPLKNKLTFENIAGCLEKATIIKSLNNRDGAPL